MPPGESVVALALVWQHSVGVDHLCDSKSNHGTFAAESELKGGIKRGN